MFHPYRSGRYFLARIKVFLSLFCAPLLGEQKKVGPLFLMRSDFWYRLCILISNTPGSKVAGKIPELAVIS
jgi:hypothetical protein